MVSRIALKHPPTAKGKIVVPTERDAYGKVAPVKVIPAAKGKKAKPLVGGPAGRHREKRDRRG